LDTYELIRRAERELDDGSRAARKTLEQARHELLQQRDVEARTVLELAGRLANGGDLTYAIQQNLSWLSPQPQGKPDRPNGVVDLSVGLFGALAGGVGGVALTFPLLSGTEPHGLVYLAAWMFFGFIGAVLGAGLAVLLRRLWLWVDRIDPRALPATTRSKRAKKRQAVKDGGGEREVSRPASARTAALSWVPTVDEPAPLRCVECGAEAPAGADGWTTYLTSDEPPEAATYCPACAAREFRD
jgi:hypothetical protein